MLEEEGTGRAYLTDQPGLRLTCMLALGAKGLMYKYFLISKLGFLGTPKSCGGFF
jgi:hypothetical protein